MIRRARGLTTENFALKQHTNRLTLIKFQSRGNRLKKKKVGTLASLLRSSQHPSLC